MTEGQIFDKKTGAEQPPQSGELINGSKTSLVRPTEVLPGIVHVLRLANPPFFPAQMVPLVLEHEPWLRTVEAVMESGHKLVGLVLVRTDNAVEAQADDIYSMGTACRIHKVVKVEDKLQIYAEGLQRFRIGEWISKQRPFVVRAQYFPETSYKDVTELKAYAVAVINTIKELLPLNPLYAEELKFFLNRFGPEEPSRLAAFAVSLTTSSKTELQDVLETTHILHRLEKVLVLLKIDKVGASFRGDPASALLEVLDPEQNKDFLDHYLDVRFDLSKVLFISTANQLDTIPAPLLHRMEVIRLGGYITSEKVEIARHHLIPRQLEKVGLKRGQLRIDKSAMRAIVERYAREAGV